MYVVNHHSTEELQALLQRTNKAKLRLWLRTILMAKELKSAKEIARFIGYSKPTIHDWVNRYNCKGLKGFDTFNTSPRGRKRKLSKQEMEKLCKRIDAGAKKKDKICVLRGREIQKILKEEMGKLHSLSSVYRLLHDLGYSLLAPRPQHYKSDAQEQASFKKKPKNR